MTEPEDQTQTGGRSRGGSGAAAPAAPPVPETVTDAEPETETAAETEPQKAPTPEELGQPEPTDVPSEDGKLSVADLVTQRIALFGVASRYGKHAIIGALSAEEKDTFTPDQAKALLDEWAEKEIEEA